MCSQNGIRIPYYETKNKLIVRKQALAYFPASRRGKGQVRADKGKNATKSLAEFVKVRQTAAKRTRGDQAPRRRTEGASAKKMGGRKTSREMCNQRPRGKWGRWRSGHR